MNLRPFRDLRLYGECGWNDTCCSTNFVPKWAASSRLAGVQLIGLFGHEGQEAGFEWAGTSTQSFTHSQFYRGYRARGSVISHVIGMDGEDYFAPLTDRFGRAVMLGVEVDRAVIGSAKHLAPVALKERRIGGALDVSYRLWAIDHLLRLELTRSFR